MTRMGPTPGNGRAYTYFIKHVMEPSDGCRRWPFGIGANGYGLVRNPDEKKTVSVHTWTCFLWHGPKPEGMTAAHSCGKKWCWAGEHLRWDTREGNARDKVAHGTFINSGVRLTDRDVRTIRYRHHHDGVRFVTLAAEYGADVATIRNAVHRKTWKHVR